MSIKKIYINYNLFKIKIIYIKIKKLNKYFVQK